MEEKDLSVKKSNYLNQASYKLSVVEQKVIALLAAQIKETDTELTDEQLTYLSDTLNLKKGYNAEVDVLYFQIVAGDSEEN